MILLISWVNIRSVFPSVSNRKCSDRQQDNSTLVDPDQPGIRFSAIPDEKIVFANYTERYLTGKVAKAPMIYSSAANEGGSLAPYPVDNPLEGPNQTVANSITERILCGAANSSIQRDRIGLTTYRYQYAGMLLQPLRQCRNGWVS